MCFWGCELIKRKVELIIVFLLPNLSWSHKSNNFSTRSCVRAESDNLPLVTWIDLVTTSTVLEDPSKLFSFPWENNRSVFGIASLPNNDQVLWEASELGGYLFVKQALDKSLRDFSDLTQCIIIAIARHKGINYNRTPQRGILCWQ